MGKKKIEKIADLEISIKYVCPNTGNEVSMSSKYTYLSPIKYEYREWRYSEHTSDSESWIEIVNSCPQCGEFHIYDL